MRPCTFGARPDGGAYAVVSGRETYEEEHIPKAGFAGLAEDRSDPASPFPFTVPSAERFGAAAGRLGVGPGAYVVVYV
jgi:thiosulfate/3-mercaptopyruvate sulfurtransferase